MFEMICRCDRCGKRLKCESQSDYPVDGAVFMVPTVTIYNTIIRDAKQIVLCANFVDELNTRFLHL